MRRTLVFALLFAFACTGASGNNPKGGTSLGFAVVSSDYRSTSVSLVDPARSGLAQDDCINSGSVSPRLSLALSGDVILTSQTQPNGELVLIDRTNSSLVYLSATTCDVTRQISVATGFYANPHDVVAISESKAYVTRFERNVTNDQGDDVLIINPQTGAITGRIDLSSYAVPVAGQALSARPDRALLIDGRVFVTLSNQSGDLMTAGPARIVILDPASDAVAGTLDLSERKNCSGLDYVAASKTLVVGCSGDYNDPANQVAQSGIVLIDVGGASPRVFKRIASEQLGGRVPGGFGVVGDNAILVTTSGEFSGTPPDALWSYTIDSGVARKLLDADGAFVLGSIGADTAHRRAFVTDASQTMPVVRVFDVSQPAAITQTSSFDANPRSGLPPRQIGWY